MKIDEPPTPYAEMPDELKNDLSQCEEFGAEEEEILDDMDPMDMSLDEQIDSADENGNEMKQKKTLDQQQQSLLLGDDEYRQKMVDDAMKRRNDNDNESSELVIGSDKESKKSKFAKKRAAHYNEFHAIKAMKAKMAQEELNE